MTVSDDEDKEEKIVPPPLSGYCELKFISSHFILLSLAACTMVPNKNRAEKRTELITEPLCPKNCVKPSSRSRLASWMPIKIRLPVLPPLCPTSTSACQMASFDPNLRDYVTSRLAETSNDLAQISMVPEVDNLQFRPIYINPESKKLIKSGGYSLVGALSPISLRFPAIIERELVGPYGQQASSPDDSWNVSYLFFTQYAY